MQQQQRDSKTTVQQQLLPQQWQHAQCKRLGTEGGLAAAAVGGGDAWMIVVACIALGNRSGGLHGNLQWRQQQHQQCGSRQWPHANDLLSLGSCDRRLHD